MSGMVRWEYKFEDDTDGLDVDNFIRLGAEGWELVTLTPYGNETWGFSVFKRPYKLCPACIKRSARRKTKVLLGETCEKCRTLVE